MVLNVRKKIQMLWINNFLKSKLVVYFNIILFIVTLFLACFSINLDLLRITYRHIIKLDIRSFAPVLTTVVGLFNLLLVIWFFNSNKLYQGRKHLADIDYYWFRKFVLEENDAIIHSSYELIIVKCITVVGKSDDEVTEAILEIKETLTTLSGSLSDPLSVLSIPLKREIEDMFIDFEDQLVEYLISGIDSKGKDIYKLKTSFDTLIKSHKINVLKKLYFYEKNLF